MLEGCTSLADCESRLKGQLAGVTIIGQIPFEREDLPILARLIDNLVARGDQQATAYLKRHTPVSFMCFLVWTGIVRYRQGDFWSGVREGVPQLSTYLQQRWGLLFRQLLDAHALPKPPLEKSLPYVTPILFHGMIPDNCLPEFFERVVRPLLDGRLVNPGSAAEIASELVALRDVHESRLKLEQQVESEKAAIWGMEKRLNLLGNLMEAWDSLQQISGLEQRVGDVSDLQDLPNDCSGRLQELETELNSLRLSAESLAEQKKRLLEAVSLFSPEDQTLLEGEQRSDEIAAGSAEWQDRFNRARELQRREETLQQHLEELARACNIQPWHDDWQDTLARIDLAALHVAARALVELEDHHRRAQEQEAVHRAAVDHLTRLRGRETAIATGLALLGVAFVWALAAPVNFLGILPLAAAAWRYTAYRRACQRAHQGLATALSNMRHFQDALQAARQAAAADLGFNPALSSDALSPELVGRLERLRSAAAALTQLRREPAELRALIDTRNSEASALAGARRRAAHAEEARQQLQQEILPALSEIEQRRQALEREKQEIVHRLTVMGRGSLEEGIGRFRERTVAWREAQRVRATAAERFPNLTLLETAYRILPPDERSMRSLEAELQKVRQELARSQARLRQFQQDLQHLPAVWPGVDEPIRRFLLFGGHVADGFLAEVLRLAVSTSSEEATSLPDRVKKAFAGWRRTAGMDVPRGKVDWPARLEPPWLHFDPVAQEVLVVHRNVVVPPDEKELLFEVAPEGHGQVSQYPLRIYAIPGGAAQAEPAQVPLPAPASRYIFSLRRRDGNRLATWLHPGFLSERPFWLFSPKGRWLEAVKPPRGLCWVVVREGCRIEVPDEAWRESGEFHGAWRGFAYHLLDLGSAPPAAVITPEGQSVEIPLQIETDDQVSLQGAEPYPGLSSMGEPVYVGKPPQLLLPARAGAALRFWSLEIHPGEGSVPTAIRRVPLSDLEPPNGHPNAGQIRVPLTDGRLLGDMPIGRFAVRAREPGGRRLETSLCLLPHLQVSYEPQVYRPASGGQPTPVQVTLTSRHRIHFEPVPPAILLSSTDTRLVIWGPAEEDLIVGRLRYREGAGEEAIIPLELMVPRVQWRLQGLPGGRLSEWQNRVEEVQIAEWDASDALHLVVRVPTPLYGPMQLVLKGSDQRATASGHSGEARFLLKAFSDTLRSGPSVRQFLLAAVSEEEGILLFQVRTHWEVTNLRCNPQLEDGRWHLHISWTEEGPAGERAVKLWRLGQAIEPVLVQPTPAGVHAVIIQARLASGRYGVEVADNDPWLVAAAPSPGTGRLLEIELGEAEAGPVGLAALDTDLIIESVRHAADQRHYKPADRYVITLYPNRVGLRPHTFLARVAIMPVRGGQAEIFWEDSVTVEYDPDRGLVTLLDDREGDGAYFCPICRRIFWSTEEYLREIDQGHKKLLDVPQEYVVRPGRPGRARA